MATKNSNDQVLLTIPMRPDMELAAAQLASVIAESMRFSEEQIEEIQFTMIESYINVIERSQNPDRRMFIKNIISTDGLEKEQIRIQTIDQGGNLAWQLQFPMTKCS